MKAAAPLILLMLLAGCVGVGDTRPAPTVPQDVEAGADIIPSSLHMDDCMGLMATQAYGPGMNPAKPPEGWQTDAGGTSSVSILAWRCDRVGLDGLERPATLLWEISTNVAWPPSCLSGAPDNNVAYVTSVATDDERLAGLLGDVYGLPVHIVAFRFEQDAATLTVTWHAESSSIAAVDEGAWRHSVLSPGRWLWAVGDAGTGWMDTEAAHNTSMYVKNRVGHGQVSPPHVLGIDGVFAGPTTVSHDAELHGAIELRGKDCA